MAQTITVYARQPFTFQGRSVAAGDELIVRPIEAAALTYQKKATFTKPAVPVAPAPPVVASAPEAERAASRPRRRRRTYKRRDLEAED